MISYSLRIIKCILELAVDMKSVISELFIKLEICNFLYEDPYNYARDADVTELCLTSPEINHSCDINGLIEYIPK